LESYLFVSVDQLHDRSDQGQVGERLGEISQMPASAGIDLLRVELEGAGERQQQGA
jgi:hypothetical protein